MSPLSSLEKETHSFFQNHLKEVWYFSSHLVLRHRDVQRGPNALWDKLLLPADLSYSQELHKVSALEPKAAILQCRQTDSWTDTQTDRQPSHRLIGWAHTCQPLQLALEMEITTHRPRPGPELTRCQGWHRAAGNREPGTTGGSQHLLVRLTPSGPRSSR